MVLALFALAALVGAAGCGAGQHTQTANQVTASGGAAGAVGSIVVRDAHFAWSGPVAGGSVYQPGEDVALQVTIVNERRGGPQPADRLVAVSSPVATSAEIDGDSRIQDGDVVTAGYDQPQASMILAGEGGVDITLIGLTTPIRAGLSYPVVFTFEHAGQLRLDVPVENPDVRPGYERAPSGRA
ncbi:putative lipoprotein LpqE [Pseudonocardia sulfidoxydans NBRC 16205]|uniref:Putative lipoprotein LpqE n=1 Tax=Pseudonocardia sulfidoxydans NBRC 16205 TaxID=1223511 RepID=A0A511DH75_9PSEU|nr:copper chaperone PCu(A)C [Pseudonocardia sulfidoxydans]GEL22338.1 putative lipoprotein LpqE [Pseudonocardia sulfidoxydans NBRC 16205]